MKKYSRSQRCPKCGSDRLHDHYLNFMGEERIERLCFNCDYRWSVRPLDSMDERREDGNTWIPNKVL
uniref:Uncharacterized protein n=1 Tax=viral metagenome TaxID=1070528 RepID=A0A6H1Z7R3_9ZZZZ